jgi:hypothetical protein
VITSCAAAFLFDMRLRNHELPLSGGDSARKSHERQQFTFARGGTTQNDLRDFRSIGLSLHRRRQGCDGLIENRAQKREFFRTIYCTTFA